jgi:uncharacterized protein YerC
MYPYMSKPLQEHRVEVPLEILKDLLTPSEWQMVKQRLLIINLLDSGLTIRAVADRAKVGTDTVVRVHRMVERNIRLKEFLKKESPTPSSKWVFGKSEE